MNTCSGRSNTRTCCDCTGTQSCKDPRPSLSANKSTYMYALMSVNIGEEDMLLINPTELGADDEMA